MTEVFTATPAKEWRNLHDVTLPSGHKVRLKRPDLFRLILKAKDGKVPNGLRSWALNKIMGKESNGTWEPKDAVDVIGYVDMMDYMCEVCFVDPPIVEKPNYANGEISIEDIDAQDREYVFKWAAPPGVGAAQTFSEQPGTGVAAAPDVQPIPDESLKGTGTEG